MAHYSSQLFYYEDGIKQPLKSISVKPLVFASYAQFGVNAGDENPGQLVMAYEISTHDLWRPIIVINLYELLLMIYYEIG